MARKKKTAPPDPVEARLDSIVTGGGVVQCVSAGVVLVPVRLEEIEALRTACSYYTGFHPERGSKDNKQTEARLDWIMERLTRLERACVKSRMSATDTLARRGAQ